MLLCRGKQWKGAQLPASQAPMWETWIKLLGPGPSLSQTWPSWPFREKTSGWKVSLNLSLPLSPGPPVSFPPSLSFLTLLSINKQKEGEGKGCCCSGFWQSGAATESCKVRKTAPFVPDTPTGRGPQRGDRPGTAATTKLQ